ncbi:transcription factor S [Natronobacterium gregoryi]|uniref:Transcription factor S n=2 Tax=Natronobacterium gregoryi TaxID=44930 RepID=L0AE72_NATGS|nr:transcription factor S [Natronobacterium gregoryi]AFZ72203.1 transcription factor S, archaeal [Natronobacterium gregoryi SP2]ELY62397.1 transcription termination factor Tfs [Natronobacterium gregoryi SP2]PLK20153.1 transcription factor S [Natronobacterium gregoryi SP2]
MEFCDECGSMMKADDGRWECGSCGYTEPKGDADQYVVTDSQEASEIIESSEETSLPETDAHCPECGHDRAYWYMQQIRAADESETRFFICSECEHKWREDDN